MGIFIKNVGTVIGSCNGIGVMQIRDGKIIIDGKVANIPVGR